MLQGIWTILFLNGVKIQFDMKEKEQMFSEIERYCISFWHSVNDTCWAKWHNHAGDILCLEWGQRYYQKFNSHDSGKTV